MPAGIKANSDGSAAIQVGGTDVITLTSGGAATFVTSPTTVQAGTAAAPSITFSGDTNTGIYSPGADTVGLTAGGTLVGSVGLGTTLALQGATSQSGTGITFPNVQNASSNINTLDDYEEGDWTPVVRGSTTAGTATYAVQVGKYTKIGRMVQIQFLVQWSGGTGTGALQITGLPFATDSTGNNIPTSSGFSSNLVLAANNVFYAGMAAGGTVMGIDQYPAGGGAATNVTYDAAASIGLSMCYIV